MAFCKFFFFCKTVKHLCQVRSGLSSQKIRIRYVHWCVGIIKRHRMLVHTGTVHVIQDEMYASVCNQEKICVGFCKVGGNVC
jgi:hypothetical protein